MVNIKVGNENIRFFAEPNIQIEYGREIKLSIDPSAIHLFDLSTGESLKSENLNEQVKEPAFS
jgi:inositol-phosphate transport system ATP-binding protein